MLCNSSQGGRKQSDQYWPNNGDILTINNIKIETMEENNYRLK